MKTRSFNTIEVLPSGHLRKVGPVNKIFNELLWYKCIPPEVRMYTPQVMHDPVVSEEFQYSYLIEHLPGETLAHFLVNNYMTSKFWTNICGKLEQLLEVLNTRGIVREIVDPLLLEKSLTRCPNSKPVAELVNWLRSEKVPSCPAVMHGDLCFSNILYDDRVNTLKVIDPRGKSSENDVYGSQLYDIAKLYHSIQGGYDFILEDRQPTARDTEHMKVMKEWLLSYTERTFGVSEKVILAMTALLFYSMLPLHSDDLSRVKRLHYRADQLYELWRQQ